MLDYKLGSGMKPICDFLEIDMPSDVEFPNTNQADQTVAILRKIMGFMILGTAIDLNQTVARRTSAMTTRAWRSSGAGIRVPAATAPEHSGVFV